VALLTTTYYIGTYMLCYLFQVEKCEKCLVYYPTESIHQCMPVAVTPEEPSNNIILKTIQLFQIV